MGAGSVSQPVGVAVTNSDVAQKASKREKVNASCCQLSLELSVEQKVTFQDGSFFPRSCLTLAVVLTRKEFSALTEVNVH